MLKPSFKRFFSYLLMWSVPSEESLATAGVLGVPQGYGSGHTRNSYTTTNMQTFGLIQTLYVINSGIIAQNDMGDGCHPLVQAK